MALREQDGLRGCRCRLPQPYRVDRWPWSCPKRLTFRTAIRCFLSGVLSRFETYWMPNDAYANIHAVHEALKELLHTARAIPVDLGKEVGRVVRDDVLALGIALKNSGCHPSET